MKVKICGLKTYDEAMAAVEAGADLLGFNFYQRSPRYITPGDCMRLQVRLQIALRGYDRQLVMVGVFVNYGTTEITTLLGDCNLDLAQLSGDESPQEMAALGEKAFKVLRPKTEADLETAIAAYPRRSGSPAWLVDAHRTGEFGGTGQTADWSLARSLAEKSPILLAGGLTPQNVAKAVKQVRPWGVDVASGVEAEPGVKDPEKMNDFVREALRLEEELDHAE